MSQAANGKLEIRIIYVQEGVEPAEMPAVSWQSIDASGVIAAIRGALESVAQPGVDRVLVEIRKDASGDGPVGTFPGRCPPRSS